MRRSLNDRLDMIIEKLESVKVTGKWDAVVDFCEKHDIDPEWLLNYLIMTRDIAMKSQARREAKNS
ncbi:hypothetical protein BAOM_3031 [Peribacillus asahii]|uniref:Uncharacterized protein n=1 Tax=Peribacillus asahii TaxID=228899 RepID=A0A3Q9RNJ9_9BACI|nr:hypothetical protein [Peribacillus asahii]AZV43640.1 hypothetical protein BAOM_3031 [Peribacillus asahii]